MNIGPAPKKPSPGQLPPSELDNHGMGLIDLQAEAKAKANEQTENSSCSPRCCKTKKGMLKRLMQRSMIIQQKTKNIKGDLQTQFIDDAFPAAKV
jgi:hypothetical protein